VFVANVCVPETTRLDSPGRGVGKIVTGTPGDLSGDAESAAYVRGRTPFARLGDPGDVATAVAFLASGDATYISGVNLMVDGGWMAY
jgi:glucose 1-dehydrogenase